MLLEALAASHGCMTDAQPKAMECTLVDGIYTADWETLIPILSDHSRPAGERALHFHQVMARTLLAQAVQIREDTGVNAIGLCGGVFQNRVLTELCMDYLAAEKFQVSLPILTPVNDGGISFGQIIEYAHLNNLVEKN
jgi:hydrogenase maturation protein HypF